ncbi:TROVE domain-containing protein [Actinomadura spongiicola]|uniref:TROVE domain-containing protein n=1 Tax=Actinomadura spongiicola TaxID=2303421 RepID=A0A372GF65_9ACTN|nr:TROVE domain-containing protein [Actinomadura spongiicola]RFS83990.1 TROVE domain-containing protein [Actinomadura spongiicola]
MAKFNRRTVRAAASGPVSTERRPSGRTYEGAPGYVRDAKSELFLLAVANMVGEKTFYESADDRDDRFRDLVHQVAVKHPAWTAGFLPWLRGEANMRSAPVVAALEAVRARLEAGLNGGNRQLVASVLQHALDRRHGRGDVIPERLTMLRARAELMAVPVADRQVVFAADGPDRLGAAGMTWESLAGWLQGPMGRRAWEAMIPTMGYMAVLRNLRNFDEAGVSDAVAEQVAARLADPEEVARSRQFPFRFFSAYLAAPSLRWGHALDKALTAATANVPEFEGRTLVLADTSASMTGMGVSERSKMNYAQMAALFGVTLAARGNRVDLHGFATGTFRHDVRRGASVLREVERFVGRIGEVGQGTQIADSVRATYAGHDRVIILSDMQTFGGGWAGNVTDAAPKNVPIYGFNLASYQHGAIPSGTGTRHELGGMTDAAFRLLPLLEAGAKADWPWEQ